MNVDAKCPGIGDRLNPDTCRQQGEEGRKLAKSYRRPLWMAP